MTHVCLSVSPSLKCLLLAEFEQVQIFELRVKLCCDNCVNKVKKKIEKMDGIQFFFCSSELKCE